MIADVFGAYRDAVTKFELLSDAVLAALADDETPAPDLLAAEEQARANVLSARTFLLAEIGRKESEVRAEWPTVPEGGPTIPADDEIRSAAYRDALVAFGRATTRV